MRATIHRINVWIKANYPKLDIELVKGEGYFYFIGKDGFDQVESIYCCHLNHAPYKWWSETVINHIEASQLGDSK